MPGGYAEDRDRAGTTGQGGPDLTGQLLDQLRRHGGRATLARRLLIEALQAQAGHRSAEDLAAIIQSRVPTVNLSTIYRNLDELERLGIVDRTHPGPGAATYHLATTTHGHLACERCGTVTEVPAELFTGLATTIQDGYGFTIKPHRTALTGLCTRCRTGHDQEKGRAPG